jgi:hypothetical protein
MTSSTIWLLNSSTHLFFIPIVSISIYLRISHRSRSMLSYLLSPDPSSRLLTSSHTHSLLHHSPLALHRLSRSVQHSFAIYSISQLSLGLSCFLWTVLLRLHPLDTFDLLTLPVFCERKIICPLHDLPGSRSHRVVNST